MIKYMLLILQIHESVKFDGFSAQEFCLTIIITVFRVLLAFFYLWFLLGFHHIFFSGEWKYLKNRL